MKKVYLTVGLAAIVGLAMTGCDKGDNVATLGGESKKPVSAEGEQAKAAEDFSACLKKADVPHEVLDQEDGQKQISFWSEDLPMAMAIGDGGSQWSVGNAETEAEQEAAYKRLEPLIAKYDPAVLGVMEENSGGGGIAVATDSSGSDPSTAPEELPRYLIIGETDYTEVFVKCLDESGYTEPVWKMDPKEELRQKELVAATTAEWTKCVRENGYPNVKDPDPPKADEFETYPTAKLPGDMTEDALRELLEACPNFDADKQAAFDKAIEEMADDAQVTDWWELEKEYGVTAPSIDFDTPGLDDPEGEIDQATLDRVSKLYDVLWEKQREYYDAQQESTSAPEMVGG
ncbi:MAG: hypothetical protein LBC97_03405 [Bifidobacteriaceae bacterium]|jgi:hypothetical protein|nr:hypothetical protein [Bifidobacteriaceae bacterium]